ncbi:MAG: hypothetical protein QHH09_03505 [Microgenomates group bacterium]|nr:hypothetical protein [Microgenomates group bacterium]
MTLTELSYYIRKYAPYALIFFLLLLIIFYLLKILMIYFNLNKPQTTYINPIFSKIERPLIPEATVSADFKFILDNIEGQPITATQAAKVYWLPQEKPKFGYREKLFLLAKTLGFDTDNVSYKLNNSEATFDDGRQKLIVDIGNFNFRYELKPENYSEYFAEPMIPDVKEAEKKATDFLIATTRYPEELSRGKVNPVFWFYNKEVGQSIVLDNNNLSNANMIEIDYYRPDIGDYPAVSPKYYNSQNYVLMVFYKEGYKILRAQVKFFEKSEEQVGVYPLISGDRAYQILQNNQALIILSPPDEKNIIIKKMFLGYFDPDVYQKYLQPVYVFLGDNNFVAYVPAVSEEYLLP